MLRLTAGHALAARAPRQGQGHHRQSKRRETTGDLIVTVEVDVPGTTDR